MCANLAESREAKYFQVQVLETLVVVPSNGSELQIFFSYPPVSYEILELVRKGQTKWTVPHSTLKDSEIIHYAIFSLYIIQCSFTHKSVNVMLSQSFLLGVMEMMLIKWFREVLRLKKDCTENDTKYTMCEAGHRATEELLPNDKMAIRNPRAQRQACCTVWYSVLWTQY